MYCCSEAKSKAWAAVVIVLACCIGMGEPSRTMTSAREDLKWRRVHKINTILLWKSSRIPTVKRTRNGPRKERLNSTAITTSVIPHTYSQSSPQLDSPRVRCKDIAAYCASALLETPSALAMASKIVKVEAKRSVRQTVAKSSYF